MLYVLVHGLGLTAEVWSKLTPLIGSPVIANDLPGHGKSTLAKYNWVELWKAVAEPIEFHEWGSTTLILHSFAAALLPEIIEAKVMPARIILLEGVLHSPDTHWTKRVAMMDDEQYENWLISFRSVSEIILRCQLKTKHDKRDIENWSQGFNLVHKDALRMISQNLLLRLKLGEIKDALSRAHFPIIYIKGEQSKFDDDSFKILKERKIQTQQISNSGHFPMIDNPVQLSSLLINNF